MQARFLCGPAGSGKTFRCLAEIRACLQKATEGLPLLFIAPKQSTFQLERQLLADGALNGYTRLHILSFERLARFVFEASNVAPPEILSDEGRVMVLRALVLRHENELKLFRGSARRPGFAQEVSRLFVEFQQHQLSAARLQVLAGNQNLRTELRDKLADLALLYARYSSWLEHHNLRDANCLLNAAAEILRGNKPVPNESKSAMPGALGTRAISKSAVRNNLAAGFTQGELGFSLDATAQVHPADTFLSANVPGRDLGFDALWLDGFAEMTPQELDLLAAILPYCNRATLAFCVDEPENLESENSWLSIWNAVGNTFRRCRRQVEQLPDCKVDVEVLQRAPERTRFAMSPALRQLEQQWEGGAADLSFSKGPLPDTDSPLKIVACRNPEGEAVMAAREILKFVRQGNRFRDCAVLVRDLEPYHKVLSRTFRHYGIPFFLDRRESVTHHPLAELTRNALRLIAFDWEQADWFAALKTGFCPVEETEIDRLENESLARGWRGKKWREPIRIPEDIRKEEEMERMRQKLVPPFELFNNGLAALKFQPDGKGLAELLRALWMDLGVEETLERWNTIQANNPLGVRRLPIHTTVWEQMKSWLADLELAFSTEAMTVRDWLPVLEAGLANLTVGVIPPALDEVLIGAIDRARNPELKFSLILGVNDSVFPATPPSSAILTDSDRDALNHVVSLGGDLRDLLARERYYGYIAFTRSSERLTVTFSRSDTAGSPLNPSPFIGRLRTLFPTLEIEHFDGSLELGQMECGNELVSLLMQMAGTAVEFGDPKVSELVKSLKNIEEANPTEQISGPMADRLYGHVLKTSVSRLEEFAQCPFKFFLRSGLKAAERKVFELDARERGTFQHDVLKEFHEQLVAEGKRWRDLLPLEARERVGRIAADMASDFRGGLLRDSARTQFAARAMTESLQDFVEVVVAWMREQYGFDPVAVELDFGEENSLLPSWKIPLDDGRELSLRGRIDRVDLCLDRVNGTGLAVVLDYKSSAKKLDPVLVEHGIQLQLAAYLKALTQFSDLHRVFGVETLVPAGVFYVNLRGQFQNGGTRGEVLAGLDGLRRAAYRHTGRFDAGTLEKLDSAGAADQFYYSRNKDGALRKGRAEGLTHSDFRAWLSAVEAQLRRIGNAIFSGAAQVDPYRKGRETACERCDYSAACRIDRWTHRFRSLAANPASTE